MGLSKMQLSGKGTGVMSILTSQFRLQDAEVSTNGQFEERTYKKFGLTIRRRRMLPELPPPVPERSQQPPLLPHESGLNNLALSIEAEDNASAAALAANIETPAEPISAEEGLAALLGFH